MPDEVGSHSDEVPRDDGSVAGPDRLIRLFAHESYSPKLEPDEKPEDVDVADLTGRLSSFGFQAIPDSRSGILGMSVYLERLLPPDGVAQLRDWWDAERAATPHSAVVLTAEDVRRAAPEEGVVIAMDVLDDEPFGNAHANIMIPVPGGKRFGGGFRRRLRDSAAVLVP
ncbi:MAG TPA: hypothetical protein VKA30_08290 [Actinomycetota bacterium]|nr:hypothetical protein [Actinomycetota bacterium]